MAFNSSRFFTFFIVVYALYLALHKRVRLQNWLLLVASYTFYGFWDWRFLFLIATSTVVGYVIGRALGRPISQAQRKLLLACSTIFNLLVLGFFKYWGFFTANLGVLLGLVGLDADPLVLDVVLPIGISFYTFQTMSYTIDVYRKRLEPTHELINFAVFVSFFPQLVAGPIERAANLLPQFAHPRRITAEKVDTGLYLILWGLFKKMVVADNAALIADPIFNNTIEHQGLDLLLGVLAFAVQIYGDFSGYSDIARGISRLLGFELMVNFRLPYFSLNPSDFWSRWHISLSSWLRDYLYIPLGGNRKGRWRTALNLMLTMVLGGLWHGAAWNFVIWGAFHGLILVLYRVLEKRPMHEDPWGGQYPYGVILLKMMVMFVLTLLGWLIFRATSIRQVVYMLSHVSFLPSDESVDLASNLVFFTLPLVAVQIYQYLKQDLLVLPKLRAWVRVPSYGFFTVWILIFGVRESIEFFYFQF